VARTARTLLVLDFLYCWPRVSRSGRRVWIAATPARYSHPFGCYISLHTAADAAAGGEDSAHTTPARQVRRHNSLSAALGGLSMSTLRAGSGGDPLMRPPQPPARWMLFNDFVITEMPAAEAQATYGGQKTPCMLYYTRVRLSFSVRKTLHSTGCLPRPLKFPDLLPKYDPALAYGRCRSLLQLVSLNSEGLHDLNKF